MGNGTVIMLRCSSFVLKFLISIIAVLFINSCVKQAEIPPSAKSVIKHYQRLAVHANSPPWTKSKITANQGDPILIVASGKVTTKRRSQFTESQHLDRPPFRKLYMKIGNHGYPIRCVDVDNTRFFRSTGTGQLMFCVGDWYQLDSKGRPVWRNKNYGVSRNFSEFGKYTYRDNSGKFIVDVFVFSNSDENRIVQTLEDLVKVNQTDHELISQLKSLVDKQRPLNLLAHAKEIQKSQPTENNLHKEKNQKSPIEDLQFIGERNNSTQQGHFVSPKIFFQGGHTGAVTSTAFSPDGEYALSGSDDKTLRLWEISTGREIRVLKGIKDYITAIAISQNGKYVLTGNDDKIIRLWNISSGNQIKYFIGHTGGVTSVAFSPDGKHALSGSNDKTLRLWDISNGKVIRVFKGHKSKVNTVAITPDNKYALSGSGDNTLRLWKLSNGKTVKIFKGHTFNVTSLAVSSDSRYVLSASADKTLRLWNIQSGNLRNIFTGHTDTVTSVAFSPDNKIALSGSWDKTLRLWNVTTGKEISISKGNTSHIYSVSFSPNGKHILSGSDDKILRLWDISSDNKFRLIKSFFKRYDNNINATTFSPDGKYALSGNLDSSLRLWEMATGKLIRTFVGHKHYVNSVSFSPNGEYILSGGWDKTVRLWNLFNGKQIRVFLGHTGPVTSVTFSPNGRFALSGSNDNTLRLWDISTGKRIEVFIGHEHFVTSIALSPDSRFILSGGLDNTLRLWDVATGKQERIFKWTFKRYFEDGYNDYINSVAFSPDGKFAISGSNEKTIRLWDVDTGKELRVFRGFFTGHTGAVNSVSFSPDGKYILSGGSDNKLRLWDLDTVRQIKIFSGHTGAINSITFSPDGKYALSGSNDGSMRLWNIGSGQEISSFYHFNNGEWMTILPDGYYANSPEGGPLLYWVLPKGIETFSFQQFESFFKKPDIINARLSGNVKAGKPAPVMTRPPRVIMPDHMALKETYDKSYPVKLTASSSKSVETVRIFVNGKPSLKVSVNGKEKELLLDVPLLSEANRITAVVYDEKGFSSNPKYVDVICKQTDLTKPKLYVFGIGISKYPKLSSSWQLEYAHTDSQAIANVFQNQEGKLFSEVRSNLLTNESATVETITEALDTLSAIDENDVAIIFMAGHGVKDTDETFFFLTSEGSFQDPQKGGLSWRILGDYLSKIKGTVILLLDACHSGSIVTETVIPNDELAQEFFTGKRGGTMVFSASKGRQYSMESPDIGGGFGIFTYALTQGLGEKSKEVDINGNNFVEFMELVEYVSDYVNKETKGEQTPWLSRKELFGDFPIAMVQ
jgi:WD40 repeat protein